MIGPVFAGFNIWMNYKNIIENIECFIYKFQKQKMKTNALFFFIIWLITIKPFLLSCSSRYFLFSLSLFDLSFNDPTFFHYESVLEGFYELSINNLFWFAFVIESYYLIIDHFYNKTLLFGIIHFWGRLCEVLSCHWALFEIMICKSEFLRQCFVNIVYLFSHFDLSEVGCKTLFCYMTISIYESWVLRCHFLKNGLKISIQ